MKIVTAALVLATGLATGMPTGLPTGSAAPAATPVAPVAPVDSVAPAHRTVVDSRIDTGIETPPVSQASLIPTRDLDDTDEPCPVRTGDGRWPNPLHECPAADPGMVIRGDTWYAFTTGLRLYVSTDQGRSWTDRGTFVETPPGYVDAWAPEVYRIGTTWICYFSLRPGPGQYAKLFVATSKNLERGWTLREEPLGEDPTVSMIDASMFQAPDGQRYLLYKEIGNRRIMIDRLSADGLTLAHEPVPILNVTQDWEGNSVEAPTMVYRPKEPRYYLFYSGALYTANGHYAVGVARADAPTADFDAGKLPDPILAEDEHFASPGHQFLTTVRIDGKPTQMLFYHAYPRFDPDGEPVSSPRRALMMDVLTWGDDGWPRVHDGTPSR